MTFYVIIASYIPQPLFEEAWVLDNVEELEKEIEFIESNKWKILTIFTVTEEE